MIHDRPFPGARTVVLTAITLIAFAGNSVLCRLALGAGSIDAASFTVLRLVSGAITLAVLVGITRRTRGLRSKGSWRASAALFLYAAAFSYAYITLEIGTGALILFGAVQTTMIAASLISGTKLRVLEWTGTLIAFSGFLYLVLPSVTTPSLAGFVFMSAAGIAWGVYTLIGRSSAAPLEDTALNFVRSLCFTVILVPFMIGNLDVSAEGVAYAVVSGSLASGIGYAIWYTALRGLSRLQAAIAQLLVPVIAAGGGIVFAGEVISLRFSIAAVLVLGGIFIGVYRRAPAIKNAGTMIQGENQEREKRG